MPTIVINEKPYRGEITAFSIIEAICSDYMEEDPKCAKYLIDDPWIIPEEPTVDYGHHKGGISVGTLVAIIIVVLVINLVILFLYRRCQRKEIDKEMQL